MNPGEGAFYGPKLEFILRDVLGREWQCGTWQVDFVLPKRLGATYIDASGAKQTPVMLHRAIFGSLERFIGILIEHHGGKFPLWLAPKQMIVVAITNNLDEYGKQVLQKFQDAGLRAEGDFRNEKLNYKIREHSLNKIPIIAICGKREVANGEITLRFMGQDKQQTVKIDVAIALLTTESQVPATFS